MCMQATRVRRARILEDGVWRLIKPGQTWKDGEVTSPSELELIYEDQLQNELQAGKKAQKPDPVSAPVPPQVGWQAAAHHLKRICRFLALHAWPCTQPSGSKRPREQPSSGPQTMRTGMVMDGMLSLAVTVEAVAGVQKFCFMPVPAGMPVPSNAIQWGGVRHADVSQTQSRRESEFTGSGPTRDMPVFMPVLSAARQSESEFQGADDEGVFFHQNDVPQLREAAEAPDKNAVGRQKQSLPKPRTAEDLYTDQFLKALSANDAPSPLTKAQALKAASNAWISVAPNVRQKYEEMADAHRRKYEEALPC
eukprot:364943-Chlamydomonas_euryale.AAC.14